MKPLTKLQEVDLMNELYDKVWELEKRFGEKYGVSVRSNYKIDKIKIEVKDTSRKAQNGLRA